jgi:hypothetical protein
VWLCIDECVLGMAWLTIGSRKYVLIVRAEVRLRRPVRFDFRRARGDEADGCGLQDAPSDFICLKIPSNV